MRRLWLLGACLVFLSGSIVSCSSGGGNASKDAADSQDGKTVDSLDDLGWDLPEGGEKDGYELIEDLPGDTPDALDVAFCGDSVCDDDEDCTSCPEDCEQCPSQCGDDTCDEDEDCQECPQDCGECVIYCTGYTGDDPCCADNNPCSLEANDQCDCAGTCSWEGDECGPDECGDGECTGSETCQECPADCGTCLPVCGDGTCEYPEETCETCDEDCGICTPNCGNSTCDPEEDCEACPQDCGVCPPECGDDQCDQGEDCENCPEDCGACGPDCGDGVLQVENGEECDDNNAFNDDGCDEFCRIEPQEATPGDVIITEIMYNPSTPLDPNGEWIELYNTTYNPININAWYLKDDGIDSHRILAIGGVVIQPQTHIVLGSNGDELTNGGVELDYVYEDFSLSNNDDEVVLWSNGVIIDEVAYASGGDWPVAVGKSISLNVLAYDDNTNDQGANWCEATAPYGDGDFGSPGQMNPVCEASSMCGDSWCQNDEDCVSCPQDCGSCPECGDNLCNGDETCQSCPGDCGACCGNGNCQSLYGEDKISCPEDCIVCGDSSCDDGESCTNCPDDCGACDPCGNGTCDWNETCLLCPADCGYCCGNGNCEPDYGETYTNCPNDCQVCGDGSCNGFETCESCATDCGACPVEGWCELSGESGSLVTCPIRLAASSQFAPKATGMEFLFQFDSTKVAFVRFHDEFCAGDTCVDWDTPPQSSIQPTGHTLSYIVQSAGHIKLLMYHGSSPTTVITNAYMTTNGVTGDPDVVEIVFVLSQTIPAETPVAVTLSGLKATDAAANPLYLSLTDLGILVTSAMGEAFCGDGGCDPFESCDTCSADCGACVCGDGTCNLNEDCTSCETDCGVCPPECGDSNCDANEDCSTCPGDCGECCGNGACESLFGEDCGSCPADCGCGCGESCQGGSCTFSACDGKECGTDGCGGSCGTCDAHYQCETGSCVYVPYCGDASCNGGETCDSCPSDCGVCPAQCGDTTCDADENCNNCPADCGDCCGNGTCDGGFGENCATCAEDCGCDCGESCTGATCVFTACNGKECGDDGCGGSCGSCGTHFACVDGGCEYVPYCGDSSCDVDESCGTCPGDCGECCGNGACQAGFGENCSTCAADCGSCCGNGTCDIAYGEDCSTCSGDCGACPGTGWCRLSGASGTEVSCLVRLANQDNTAPDAVGAEFVVNFDHTKVSFVRYHDTMCIGDTCFDWDTPTAGSIQPSGHTLSYQTIANGQIKTLLYHGGDPTTPLTGAYLDGDGIAGDPDLFELVFNLDVPIPAGSPVEVTLTSLKATDAEANLLTATTSEGLILTSLSGAPYCGNGTCDTTESCYTCHDDCGTCCGNGTCDTSQGESCANCPSDCGTCGPVCGDGSCEAGEDCSSCNADCGCDCGETCSTGVCTFTACDTAQCGSDGCGGSCGTCDTHYDCLTGTCVYVPYCGDATCDDGESCDSCPGDCGECCGNGSCEAGFGENCSTCASDCGECPPDCGDGTCASNEDCSTCPLDCGCEACGESCVAGTCTFTACDTAQCGSDGCGGSCGTCGTHYDCLTGTCVYVPYCGDATCDDGESCDSCPGDCGQCCGNGSCEAGYGEDCSTCETDCGPCGPVCGDATCEGDETCDTCAADCGACPTGWCVLSGTSGSQASCEVLLAAESSSSPAPCAMEFIFQFDATRATFSKFHDLYCIGETCLDWDSPPQSSIQPSSHTITSNTLEAGKVKALLYHGSAPSTPITGAYWSGSAVSGDDAVVEMVFTLNQTISPSDPVIVELSGLKASDAGANALTMAVQSGVLTTSAQ